MKYLSLLLLSLFSVNLSAETISSFEVTGVIASNLSSNSIAILKNSSGKTILIKSGEDIDSRYTLHSVGRKKIIVAKGDKFFSIEVGGKTGVDDLPYQARGVDSDVYVANDAQRQLEVKGAEVKVSQEYKDHLINANLKDILMQAAAVPHIKDGELKGFELWEIESNSVFQIAGFKDGDVVTKINGKQINDIGRTVQMLNHLRNAPRADFEYTRNGESKTLSVVVQ